MPGESQQHAAALFSVYDRTGVVELAKDFASAGVAIYATSGTRAHLRGAGIDARDVDELTGFPALFEGRVKTLHPKIFGGILGDFGSAAHREEAQRYGFGPIAAVVVNLYPFEQTVARGATLEEAIEQIDIGGVALIRAAAKNFENVTVLVDPQQYPAVRAALPGGVDESARRKLATRAFERTAEYDAAIARYLEAGLLPSELPGSLALTLPLAEKLRYGENPQSRAAFYLSSTDAFPEQLWGKALSYNNMLDLDATLRLLVRAPSPERGESEHAQDPPPVRAAVVKHTVPCGVAERRETASALREALESDPISAFGGIVAVDGHLDAASAEILSAYFLEIVAAPHFSDDALERLRRKRNLRIIRYEASLPGRLARELRVRSALGGVLAEDDDPGSPPERWRIVSQRAPSPSEWADLRFAWDVVRHVKSNGVVVVKDGATRGICAGQTNRVSAVRIATKRAGQWSRGAACASDGFFPFSDGLEAAAAAGCSAVIAPEGSIRDAEVIASADAQAISLVFSTYRYFLH
ncbi:MAG: bifunctional phosphoribosylaminoimidazolecarboxamide formyltransferase/IMP cyclohydrolase [Candidatus Eremiobacteraeota bacterium]|nr:bifunctional phosphoribosylaminoimidazolecarboxamide formyltransferase/IMP cyclohydrolase [Candidatus Eremiobacteraeota bacterium]